MVDSFASAALKVADLESLKSSSIDGASVSDILTDRIATVGENMSLRRMKIISGDKVVSYVHNSAAQDMGCLLYTSPSPRDATLSRMPSSA